MIDYLKDTINYCAFIKKTSKPYLKNKNLYEEGYIKILELDNYDKSLWRDIIKEWQFIESELLKNVPKYPIIPQSWIDERKVESVRFNKAKEEVNFKIARKSDTSRSDYVFESNIINLENFENTKKFIIYQTEEHKDKLKLLFEIGKKFQNKVLDVAIVGIQDYKKLENIKIHNLVKMEDFLISKYKVIARYVTGYKIGRLINKNEEVFKFVDYIRSNISKEYALKLEKLKTYHTNNYSFHNELIEELEKSCDENKFYDYSIYQEYLDVEKEINKISFIKLFIDKTSRYSYDSKINEQALPIIKELLIARKFKMDYFQYPEYIAKETEELKKLKEQQELEQLEQLEESKELESLEVIQED